VKTEFQDSAALHALGMAAPEESEALLLASEQDPELAAELESFRQVAAGMSEVVAVEPPPHVRDKLMARIRASSDTLQDGVLTIVRASDGKWLPTPFAGITMKQLFYDPVSGNQSVLVRMEPGAVYPHHHHKGLEHSLVLEGDAVFSDHTLFAGDYEVGASDRDHSSITTKGGCLVFIMRNRADIVYAT
jgi:mannose-6-phosphate isomerase-like protein (cupin superfamily)